MPAAAGAGRLGRSLSANRPGAGDDEPAADAPRFREFFRHLDFWQKLENLYQGPWEWLLPEAQASKGTSLPLRGALDAGAELQPCYLTSTLRPD